MGVKEYNSFYDELVERAIDENVYFRRSTVSSGENSFSAFDVAVTIPGKGNFQVFVFDGKTVLYENGELVEFFSVNDSRIDRMLRFADSLVPEWYKLKEILV